MGLHRLILGLNPCARGHQRTQYAHRAATQRHFFLNSKLLPVELRNDQFWQKRRSKAGIVAGFRFSGFDWVVLSTFDEISCLISDRISFSEVLLCVFSISPDRFQQSKAAYAD